MKKSNKNNKNTLKFDKYISDLFMNKLSFSIFLIISLIVVLSSISIIDYSYSLMNDTEPSFALEIKSRPKSNAGITPL